MQSAAKDDGEMLDGEMQSAAKDGGEMQSAAKDGGEMQSAAKDGGEMQSAAKDGGEMQSALYTDRGNRPGSNPNGPYRPRGALPVPVPCPYWPSDHSLTARS